MFEILQSGDAPIATTWPRGSGDPLRRADCGDLDARYFFSFVADEEGPQYARPQKGATGGPGDAVGVLPLKNSHQVVKHLFLFALLFVGVSCSRDPLPRDQSLIVAIPQDPVMLDPRLATDAQGAKISDLIFDGLFTKNDRLEVVPNLAERYEQPNPTTYRFFLRHGVKFHDGVELTAKDVVTTLASWKDPKLNSPFRSIGERMASITALDDTTVEVILTEPYAPFLTALMRGIVPAHLADDKDFGNHPVGTGPYRFVGWRKDSNMLLKANPDYFGEKPKIPNLVFHVVKDDNTRVLKLLAGELDLVQNAVPIPLLDKIKMKEDLQVASAPGITVAYLGLNLKDPILKNPKVREALAYATDKQELITYKWNGFAEPADSLMAPNHWSHASGLNPYHYNVAKAMRLLDEAGFKDPDGEGPLPRFSITLKTSTVKERVAIAQMLAHQWAKVGVQVQVQSFEWGTFYEDIRNGRFQLYTLTWVGLTEPDIFYDVANSSRVPPDGANRGFYSNKEIDRLTELGRKTLDVSARKIIYGEIQHILNEELPFIPLWYENNIAVTRKDLKNVTLRPDASYSTFINISR